MIESFKNPKFTASSWDDEDDWDDEPDWVNEDGTLEELSDEDIPLNADHQVIEQVREGSTVYQLRKIRCGKPSCKSCPHGPYWYSYQRLNGKIVSKYIGKQR